MGDITDVEASAGKDVKKMAPPSKRRMEAEKGAIIKKIGKKQAELKALQGDIRIENIPLELKNIRSEKEVKIKERRSIDQQKNALSGEISKKKEELAKQKSSLPYLKEEKIDETIRSLRGQLQRQNLRIRDEKKIVNEIDSLTRSKKLLSKYHAGDAELKVLQEEQQRMREQMAACYKIVSDLKARETSLRSKHEEWKQKQATLEREINELHSEKRDIIAEYTRQEREYKEMKEARERQNKKEKQEEMPRTRQEQQPMDFKAVSAVNVDPYGKEKQLCDTLIAYLKRLIPAPEPEPKVSEPTVAVDCSCAEHDGFFVLPRKHLDTDVKYGAAARRSSGKKNKRDRQKRPQKISHTPEIFAQFGQLNLNAPANLTEAAASIEQLEGRKLYYEKVVEEKSDADQSPVVNAAGDAASFMSICDASFKRAPQQDPGTMAETSQSRPDDQSVTAHSPVSELTSDETSAQEKRTDLCSTEGKENPLNNNSVMDSRSFGRDAIVENYFVKIITGSRSLSFSDKSEAASPPECAIDEVNCPSEARDKDLGQGPGSDIDQSQDGSEMTDSLDSDIDLIRLLESGRGLDDVLIHAVICPKERGSPDSLNRVMESEGKTEDR